jgi:hypothetical protein
MLHGVNNCVGATSRSVMRSSVMLLKSRMPVLARMHELGVASPVRKRRSPSARVGLDVCDASKKRLLGRDCPQVQVPLTGNHGAGVGHSHSFARRDVDIVSPRLWQNASRRVLINDSNTCTLNRLRGPGHRTFCQSTIWYWNYVRGDR